MARFLCFFLVLVAVFETSFSLFREEHLMTTKDTRPPYLLRILNHVYFIGVMDNGTLSCKMPGAVSYTWNRISKEEIAQGGYVYSWIDQLKIQDPAKPWQMEIDHYSFRTDSQLIQCQGHSGYGDHLVAEILWVITRLHSPLGYPTDPIICSGKTCNNYKRLFSIECNPDDGTSYRGTVSRTKLGKNCREWTAVPLDWRWYRDYTYYEGMKSKFRNKIYAGEHNYCRSYRRGKQFLPPCCFLEGHNDNKRELCDIPSCSNCMYGDGNGKLIGYGVHLPKYNGTGIETLQVYTSGQRKKYRQCYRNYKASDKSLFKFWFTQNVCKHKLTIRDIKFDKTSKPSCLVSKGTSSTEPNVPGNKREIDRHLKLARCRIRQCTVRLVWFLFLDENDHLIVDAMSSQKARKFITLRGQKFKIYYFAFGVNLKSGLSIKSVNGTNKDIVKKWKNSLERVPRISVLNLGKVNEKHSGEYYFLYEFEEADNTIQLGVYSQQFEIEVRQPLTISLSPKQVNICERQKATIQLETKYRVRTDDIKWSYKRHAGLAQTPVTFDTTFITISNDAMKVTVSKSAWIYTTVKWSHGVVKAQARVTIFGKPTLQNISPLFTIAKRGSFVTMAVVTNSQKNKLIWIHDAQQIAEVPDDPDMAFYRTYISLTETIYSLKIDNVADKHYGVFTVKASNSHKCENSLEFILRKGAVSKSQENQQNIYDQATIPLTNASVTQFKKVMNFMEQECSDIVGLPEELPTADSSEENNNDTNEEIEEESEIEPEEEIVLEEESRRRKKRNAPVKIHDMISASEPFCIYVQLAKPYFEIDLGSYTRIKGISLLQSDEEEDIDGLFTCSFSLMYSLDGCKWKIYGITLYKSNNVSNITNIASQSNDTNQVMLQLQRLETEAFSSNGNITWIGNRSLIFARYLRLIPTSIDSRNKTCIRLNVYGCSASILEVIKETEEADGKTESDSSSVILLVIIISVASVLIIGGLVAWRMCKKGQDFTGCECSKIIRHIPGQLKNAWNYLTSLICSCLKRSKLVSSDSNSESGSESDLIYESCKEDHFYEEIPSITEQHVPYNDRLINAWGYLKKLIHTTFNLLRSKLVTSSDSNSKSGSESSGSESSESDESCKKEHFYYEIPYTEVSLNPESSNLEIGSAE